MHVIIKALIPIILLSLHSLCEAADYSAPVILGNTHIVTHQVTDNAEIFVTVTDNELVRAVNLKYRKIGDTTPYSSVALPRVSFEQDVFGTVFDKLFLALFPAGIEYYIEATDTSLNITQSPFPDQPNRFTLSLDTKPSTPAGSLFNKAPLASSPRGESAGSRKNWIWYVLGALAVGAVVANSSSDSDSNDQTATVTITVPTPTND